MSVNDYMESLKRRNPKLFEHKSRVLKITAQSLEKQLRLAFEAGRDSAWPERPSLFKSIFG